MTRKAFVLLGLVTACGGSGAAGPAPDGGIAGDGPAGSDPCADAGMPPSTLECTGLYADFATKTLAPTAQPYAPALPLWSDGADKARWIALPAGQPIDASDPNEWVFPVGTKVWKEFSYQGRRVETRLFEKVSPISWARATYAWDANESSTRISYGESVELGDGGSWVIPTPQDCDACHHGRTDRILGFEEVNLGLAGASGLTLGQLVANGLLAPPPPRVTLAIGDDGTGLDAPALGWLHVNCGVTCHNANEGAQAYGGGMFLRLDPRWLNGSPANGGWDPLRTTIGVPCVSGTVAGEPRVVPGDPSSSEVVQLSSERGDLQMPPPPLSRLVDGPDVAALAAWVQHLPHAEPADAGDDGANDAGSSDAGDGAITGEAGDGDAADAVDAGPFDGISGDGASLDAMEQ